MYFLLGGGVACCHGWGVAEPTQSGQDPGLPALLRMACLVFSPGAECWHCMWAPAVLKLDHPALECWRLYFFPNSMSFSLELSSTHSGNTHCVFVSLSSLSEMAGQRCFLL